jgi:GNAT superfamily N-acetyltransferase
MERAGAWLGVRAYAVFSRALGSAVAARPAGLALRMVPEREAMKLAADPCLDLRAPSVRAAFARGDLCVGAFDGGKLAGYAWFAQAPAPHVMGLQVRFAAHVVYTYKTFVRPQYRGRGIAPALYAFPDAHFRALGRSEAALCVDTHNRASIAAARKSGGALAGWLAYWHRGRHFRAYHSPGLAPLGLRFYLA